jgi:hypothetical protein
LIEPLEREVRALRALTALHTLGEHTSLVRRELPYEQYEEENDETDGRALCNEQRTAAHS